MICSVIEPHGVHGFHSDCLASASFLSVCRVVIACLIGLHSCKKWEDMCRIWGASENCQKFEGFISPLHSQMNGIHLLFDRYSDTFL